MDIRKQITPGSELYMVYDDSRYGRDGTVVVKTVGRIWITVLDGRHEIRFPIETMRSEHGRSKLYMSKAESDAIKERNSAWGLLRKSVMDAYRAPDHLDTETMLQIVSMLKPKSEGQSDE